jgi:hypothetical protein
MRLGSILGGGIRAALPAAAFAGAPSTIHALVTDGDPLEASLAAGSLFLPEEHRTSRLLVAAGAAHLSISLGWGVVLATVLPRTRPIAEGIVVGLAIAALDLGLIGSRIPRIKALRVAPQVADHIAFGVVASLVLSRIGPRP